MTEPKAAFKIGRARLVAIWDSVWESFWFVPGVMAVLAVIAGIGLPILDDAVDIEDWERFQWLATTAGTARVTLSSLAGAMITVAGVVFSVTMVTLSLTSSQFGSRLLRTFLDNNVTQFALGAFLATSLYCMVVLRTVRYTDTIHYVPHISVSVAVAMTVVSLVVFVYFIHHIVESIQAQNVVRAVYHDLQDAVDRLFPDEFESQNAEEADNDLAESFGEKAAEDVQELTSHEDGYLVAIDVEEVLAAATGADVKVSLLCRPGHFAGRGTPIARIFPPDRCDDELEATFRACFVVGSRRTPRQDLECAIDELVEVAVRALSPGINDPITAIACVDYLGAALSQLAGRKNPPRCLYDDDGEPRVVTFSVSFRNALNNAYDPLRQYARRATGVTIRLLESLIAVSRHIVRPDDAATVIRQAEMIVRGSTQELPEERDREDVRSRFQKLQTLLAEKFPSGGDSK